MTAHIAGSAHTGLLFGDLQNDFALVALSEKGR